MPTSFPSRCSKVGNINCFFLSCFHSGKIPIINIGPNIGPMTCCFFLVILISFLMLTSISRMNDGWYKILS